MIARSQEATALNTDKPSLICTRCNERAEVFVKASRPDVEAYLNCACTREEDDLRHRNLGRYSLSFALPKPLPSAVWLIRRAPFVAAALTRYFANTPSCVRQRVERGPALPPGPLFYESTPGN
jgi:hypothetical protein